MAGPCRFARRRRHDHQIGAPSRAKNTANGSTAPTAGEQPLGRGREGVPAGAQTGEETVGRHGLVPGRAQRYRQRGALDAVLEGVQLRLQRLEVGLSPAHLALQRHDLTEVLGLGHQGAHPLDAGAHGLEPALGVDVLRGDVLRGRVALQHRADLGELVQRGVELVRRHRQGQGAETRTRHRAGWGTLRCRTAAPGRPGLPVPICSLSTWACSPVAMLRT